MKVYCMYTFAKQIAIIFVHMVPTCSNILHIYIYYIYKTYFYVYYIYIYT